MPQVPTLLLASLTKKCLKIWSKHEFEAKTIVMTESWVFLLIFQNILFEDWQELEIWKMTEKRCPNISCTQKVNKKLSLISIIWWLTCILLRLMGDPGKWCGQWQVQAGIVFVFSLVPILFWQRQQPIVWTNNCEVLHLQLIIHPPLVHTTSQQQDSCRHRTIKAV